MSVSSATCVSSDCDWPVSRSFTVTSTGTVGGGAPTSPITAFGVSLDSMPSV